MSDASSPQLTQRAGKHLPSVVAFLGLAVFILAADLIFKTWAFNHVAGETLILSRDANDGSTLVQIRAERGELETLPRARPGEPASAIPPHEGITVVPSVLALRLTINTGAVFGIGKGAQWFFAAVSVIASVVIGVVFFRSARTSRLLHICLAMILGGAIGNLYDRLMYNGVRDMCHLFPGVKLPFGWTWAGGADEVYPWIFNIADAALVVGVLILLVLSWRADKPQPKDQSRPG